MRKLDMERMGNVAKHVGEFVVKGLVSALVVAAFRSEATHSKPNSSRDFSRFYCDYGDAVEAIMNSDMSSFYKNEAIDALTRDGNAEFYRAIISIVNGSNTSSYYKADVIKKLSKR